MLMNNKDELFFSRSASNSSGDEVDDEVDVDEQRGEYTLPPVSDMYANDAFSDDENEKNNEENNRNGKSGLPLNKPLISVVGERDFETRLDFHLLLFITDN